MSFWDCCDNSSSTVIILAYSLVTVIVNYTELFIYWGTSEHSTDNNNNTNYNDTNSCKFSLIARLLHESRGLEGKIGHTGCNTKGLWWNMPSHGLEFFPMSVLSFKTSKQMKLWTADYMVKRRWKSSKTVIEMARWKANSQKLKGQFSVSGVVGLKIYSRLLWLIMSIYFMINKT